MRGAYGWDSNNGESFDYPFYKVYLPKVKNPISNPLICRKENESDAEDFGDLPFPA